MPGYAQVDALASGLGRSAIRWQEVWEHFGTALPVGTVVHIWEPSPTATMGNVTAHGYRAIFSNNKVYYLDNSECGRGGCPPESSSLSRGLPCKSDGERAAEGLACTLVFDECPSSPQWRRAGPHSMMQIPSRGWLLGLRRLC